MADEQAIRRKHLGQLVRRARATERIEDIANRADVSPRTWGSVEKGASSKPFSLRKIEAVLGWPQGAIDTYLDTGNESALHQHQQPEPRNLIDWVVDLDHRPDAIKVFLVRVLRRGGDPTGVILDSGAALAVKVEAIEALREAEALAKAAAQEERERADTG